jgi:hypothetical protein
MRRAIGKRRTLDRFFTRVKREARDLAGPTAALVVAYGSCGPTMSPGGRGEMSVPTTEAYRRCLAVMRDNRRYGVGRVRLVDEYRTTKFSIDTGRENARVYLRAHGRICTRRRPGGSSQPIRGLHFCPTRRTLIDRDANSAWCILNLCVFEMRGLPRPAPFARP